MRLYLMHLLCVNLQHCGPGEPSSPLLLMERLSFEMHKTYTETRLQLHLSPATIILVDGNEVRQPSLAMLSVLQFIWYCQVGIVTSDWLRMLRESSGPITTK